MRSDPDVVIVGAGPVGLTLANILGLRGIATLVVEERDTLIDYPRGVGLDDEALRAFQSIGLVDRVLPHTVPNQIWRFMGTKGRLVAEMAPSDNSFGWPKRNAFVQPLVDAELLAGLDRFSHVDVAWSMRMQACTTAGDHVTVELVGPDRDTSTVRAAWVAGCDGGRSTVRHAMGVSFDGTTSPTRWLVVDVANDPLGHPNTEAGGDPQRPYVSISIAHGIQRFEFMIHSDETDEQAESQAFVTRMLAPFVPYPERVDVIRRRVYTHHSRIASTFRRGRLMLAGDAAHLMPVWQGQGYNSGIRDAINLGWKLAAVVNGQADDALLDTYDIERRSHAKSMIDLSVLVGRIISPTSHSIAVARDWLLRAATVAPGLKQYLLQMRFKPMPYFHSGAVVHTEPLDSRSPTGRLFIQPRVDTRDESDVLLDDILGPGFAVLCWNNHPRALLDPAIFERWKALGTRFVAARPLSELYWAGRDDPDTFIVGDSTGVLQRWFAQHTESVLFLRPDRYVASACIAQFASAYSEALFGALQLTPEGGDSAASSVLPFPQHTSESSGTAAGTA